MPFQGEAAHVLIDSIKINRDNRQRREVKIDDLKPSIAARGLYHPIIIDENSVLVSGERRLEACRSLGWTTIPVRFASDLDPIELQIVELEENIKRKDLEWQELANSVANIHNLYVQIDPGWTATETATALGLTEGTVSLYRRVASNLSEGDRLVTAAGTVREAYNIISRRDQRRAGEAIQLLLEQPPQPITPTNDDEMPTPPSSPPSTPSFIESILNLDFLDWAPTYEGPKFNFIHCDFPYGKAIFDGPQGRGASDTHYTDTPKTFQTLLNTLCVNLPRLASVSTHLMFWYSAEYYPLILQTFEQLAPAVSFYKFPLIWLKSDNHGISSNPRTDPRHIYETCLFGSIGSRNLIQVRGDAYQCPTDHRLHPSTKPESMLRHFMFMVVDEHTSMLDPTCGSGSALRAAESLGAKSVLGLESDWTFCEAARLELKNFRLKRSAEKTFKEAAQ